MNFLRKFFSIAQIFKWSLMIKLPTVLILSIQSWYSGLSTDQRLLFVFFLAKKTWNHVENVCYNSTLEMRVKLVLKNIWQLRNIRKRYKRLQRLVHWRNIWHHHSIKYWQDATVFGHIMWWSLIIVLNQVNVHDWM